MNVMFLTLENYTNFQGRSIYLDLVNKFIEKGHYVTVISAREERDAKAGDLDYYDCGESGEIYKVNTSNVTKVDNFIAKGFSLVGLLPKYRTMAVKAMKKRNYDLVFYGSPPITVYWAVNAVKKKQGAASYLLLKDIWPYDCVFGGALEQNGWKKIAFDILVHMARKLYAVSDRIGCMSNANIRFLTDNEPKLDKRKVEINPNSIEPLVKNISEEEKKELREHYQLPKDKKIFLYGGSLGIPQGIDFAMESVEKSMVVSDSFFLFVGSGTERDHIEQIAREKKLTNFRLMPAIPKQEYENLVYACDVGLIYLNYECQSPNYPSRLLTYMQAALPVLCATDTYTDIGQDAEAGEYGVWCPSNDPQRFAELVRNMCESGCIEKMGKKARDTLLSRYSVENSYNIIIESMEKK